MSEITTEVSAIPLLRHRDTVSTPADQDDFVTKYEATNDHLSNNTVGEMNDIGDEMNIVAGEVNTNALTAQAAGNYQGDWSLTPTSPVVYPYPLGISVSNGGFRWASKVNSNTEEPVGESSNWVLLDSLDNAVFTGSITEELSVHTGTVVTSDNGTINTFTMTGDVTFTDGLSDNQGIRFRVTNGGFTMLGIFDVDANYIGNAKPTLTTTDDFIIYRTGSAIQIAYVGSVVA